MIAPDLPSDGAGRRNQPAAPRELVEVFDDDIGIHDDLAIVCYQRRQLLHRVDARIFVVALARRQRGRDQFDLVDQAEFDRDNAHLAGEWRGRGECEFHRVFLYGKEVFLFPSWPGKSAKRVFALDAPPIHALSCCHAVKTWMPGTSPGMTRMAPTHSAAPRSSSC